jgi:hypothetical protein
MLARPGPQLVSPGVLHLPRSNKDASLIVEINGAKYAEDARRGRLFTVANAAAVALTAALNTTYTGLVIGNPAGSGKLIELLQLFYGTTVAVPTATALGLMSGSMAAIATNAVTPKNRLIGGPTGVAWASSGGTIGTPTLDYVFATAWTAATTAGTLSQPNMFDVDGNTVLPPGTFAAVWSAAANTAAFWFSFLFREVDQSS